MLKVCNSMILTIFTVTQPSTQSIVEISIISRTNHAPIRSYSPFPSSLLISRRQRIYFLSLWICLFGVFYINGIIKYVAFRDSVLSFIKMFSRFIFIVACISTAFLSTTELCFTLKKKIHLSVDRHLGCFHVGTIMNNAAINICAQCFL